MRGPVTSSHMLLSLLLGLQLLAVSIGSDNSLSGLQMLAEQYLRQDQADRTLLAKAKGNQRLEAHLAEYMGVPSLRRFSCLPYNKENQSQLIDEGYVFSLPMAGANATSADSFEGLDLRCRPFTDDDTRQHTLWRDRQQLAENKRRRRLLGDLARTLQAINMCYPAETFSALPYEKRLGYFDEFDDNDKSPAFFYCTYDFPDDVFLRVAGEHLHALAKLRQREVLGWEAPEVLLHCPVGSDERVKGMPYIIPDEDGRPCTVLDDEKILAEWRGRMTGQLVTALRAHVPDTLAHHLETLMQENVARCECFPLDQFDLQSDEIKMQLVFAEHCEPEEWKTERCGWTVDRPALRAALQKLEL